MTTPILPTGPLTLDGINKALRDIISTLNTKGTGNAALVQDGLAGAGTDRSGATALVAGYNRFSTCTTGAGALLPSATAEGLMVNISGLLACADFPIVYAAGTDTIDTIAGATGEKIQAVNTVTITDGYTIVCSAPGAWLAIKPF